jgi:FdhE protein
MMPAQTGGPNYNARVRRAQHLGSIHSFAAEVMNFYGHLVVFQKRVDAFLSKSGKHVPANPENMSAGFRSQLDLALLLPHFPDLLSLLESAGPTPVATAARELSVQGASKWSTSLTRYWTSSGDVGHSHSGEERPSSEVLTEFILRVFLQPYAEFVAARWATARLEATPSVCPVCNSVPLLGVLRPEGDGGRRCLVCSFCLHEWNFRRILCPACGEEAESKLPVYVAEQFPHVRVEACDTCKSYVRTIDLTKDGNAIPLVDDLAAIPLSLWADEHHYSRLHPNLLRT